MLAVSLTLLAGCQTTGSGVTEVCAVWKPVLWSSRDTPETIDGVKGNNARRAAWCRT
ncbi:hypothetical protein CYD53_10546 [Bosea psychrotolerans]|uniref:Uncharacterized protein n=2 Tax=Bosea psychrotolerans TaxID=1871628 RepID=A0A2S4MCK0_9HYPH|nr:hypothetical protein CYD53_10546 [Bosea psychrotolerans]